MNNLLNNVFISMQVSISKQDVKAINDKAIIIRDLLNNYHELGIHNDDEVLIQLYKFTQSFESGIISNLKNGDSRAAKSLTDSLLILEKYLKYFDSNEISNTYKAEKLLNISTDNSVLIGIYDNSKNRGIGKSTELVKLANKLDITLITDSDSSKRHLDELARSLCTPVDIRYVNNSQSARGVRCKNKKFLVDESVDKNIIDTLVDGKNELVAGLLHLNIQNI